MQSPWPRSRLLLWMPPTAALITSCSRWCSATTLLGAQHVLMLPSSRLLLRSCRTVCQCWWHSSWVGVGVAGRGSPQRCGLVTNVIMSALLSRRMRPWSLEVVSSAMVARKVVGFCPAALMATVDSRGRCERVAFPDSGRQLWAKCCPRTMVRRALSGSPYNTRWRPVLFVVRRDFWEALSIL